MQSYFWFLLCALSALSASTATPIRASLDSITPDHQQLLREDRAYKGRPARPVLDSVGVLFTMRDGTGVMHAWLPLGRKIYTRDVPDLPLHPLSARITTMILSTPANATREHLDRVVCKIHPRYNRTRNNQAESEGGEWSISFSRSDELVRFVEVGSASWLVGREVEAYECS